MTAQELQSITSMGWSIIVIGLQVLIMVGIFAAVCGLIAGVFHRTSKEEAILQLQIRKQTLENIANGLPADSKPAKVPDVNFDFKITGNTRD